MPLPISCGLEVVDQQVEYTLIRTFRLLKEILWSLGNLFQEKTLELSIKIHIKFQKNEKIINK